RLSSPLFSPPLSSLLPLFSPSPTLLLPPPRPPPSPSSSPSPSSLPPPRLCLPPVSPLPQCAPSGKHPSLSGQLSSSSTPPMGTPKSQSGTPRPASVVGSHLQAAGSRTPSSTGHPDSEPPQSRPGGLGASNNISSTPSHQPGNAVAPIPSGPGPGGVLPHASAGVSPSGSPSVLSAHLQVDVGARGGDGGLSKEQLEHRERSLQTLRDIERLLLRSGTAGGAGEPPGPNNNPNNVNNNNTEGSGGGPQEDAENSGNNNNDANNMLLPPMGKMKNLSGPSSPRRSIWGGAGGMDGSPVGGPHHPDRHLHSPGGLDMGPLLGPDGLTPEQVAWRQLQEDYYQEKRRQEELQPNPHTHPQHFRLMQEMSPPVMMRGPPPPYHSKSGEQQWGPGGPMMGMGPGNPRMIDMHQEGPRGPRFLGQMQRVPPGGGGFPSSPGGCYPSRVSAPSGQPGQACG
ncbi:unnamed protein product, partial [Oncorhynchus mykiss]